MDGLIAYGHSWIQGDGASGPARRLVDVAAREFGCEPINLGVGGSASTDTADLVGREPPPPRRNDAGHAELARAVVRAVQPVTAFGSPPTTHEGGHHG
jgi:hypothetical protein